MLKSLLSSWSCEEGNKQMSSERTNHNIFLVIFKRIPVALKPEKVCTTFSSFNPYLSSSPVATDDRKQLQCLYIVFNNKTGPLF